MNIGECVANQGKDSISLAEQAHAVIAGIAHAAGFEVVEVGAVEQVPAKTDDQAE